MFQIGYGFYTHKEYVEARETIVTDFNNGNMSGVVEKINNAFFKGGVFSAKSFDNLASIEMPKHPSEIYGRAAVEITRQTSISAVLGYVEAIPVIGSFLAVVNAIGHLFFMCLSYLALRSAIRSCDAADGSATPKVFKAAVAYTVHRNHLLGSLLSILPFAKPMVRLGQGFYHEYVAAAMIHART